MRRVRQRGYQVFGFLILAGCSSTALLDAPDDMAAPGNGQAGGSAGSACIACFDTDCAWQATECAGDPECAQWLTCAREAPASAEGTADAAWLATSCGATESSSGRSLREALQSCVTTRPCCAASRGGGEPQPGLGGDGGAGPTYGSDAGADGEDWNDDAAELWDCGTGAANCNCISCLKTLGNADNVNVTSCDPAKVSACLGHDACHGFLVAFANCASDIRQNPESASIAAIEACLYGAILENPHLKEGATAFMTDVLPCAWSACSSYCAVDSAKPCLSCQGTACTSELRAYAANPDAYLYRWCRSYCDAHGNEASCLDECKVHKAAAQETLTVYGACVTSSCGDVCQ